MTVLKTADIGRIPICATDNAKEAIVGRPAAYHHAFFVAPRHAKLPMLSHRNTPYQCLEVFERGKPLAHMQARVHLRHFDQENRRKANSGESMPTKLSISGASLEVTDSRNRSTGFA